MRKIAALAALALTLLMAASATGVAYWQPSGNGGNVLQFLAGGLHHGRSFSDGH
jgi:hypothetical protein